MIFHFNISCCDIMLPPRTFELRHSLLCLVFMLSACAVQASAWVTEDDARREAEFQQVTPLKPDRTRAISPVDVEAPLIEVIRPNPLNNLSLPFAVELRFSSRSGAPIDPNSLRVSYGFMRVDLTERIRKSATVTAEGLRAESVEIPKGKHRLNVTVADTVGHVGEKEIQFSVGE